MKHNHCVNRQLDKGQREAEMLPSIVLATLALAKPSYLRIAMLFGCRSSSAAGTPASVSRAPLRVARTLRSAARAVNTQ